MTTFGIHVLERLNESVDLFEPVGEILEEIRLFFEFGSIFVYVADHQGLFHLRENSQAFVKRPLEGTIDLRAQLGDALMDELSKEKAVLFPMDEEELTPLMQRLSAMFDAQSMIVIPIKDQHGKLIALVGLADRRGVHRHEKLWVNMKFAYALLAAVANHIKLRLYQIRIESTQKSLESVLDHMGVDIYVNDFHTHEILYVNQSMAAPYGGKEKVLGGTCWDVLYEDKTGQCDYCPQKKLLDERGDPTRIYSWDYQRPFDGSWFRVLSGAFEWVDGRTAHVVSSVDITENKQNEATIRQLAEYDSLTALPNRRKLLDDCGTALAQCQADGREGYLLFFDLDGFKRINDEIGHRAGDDLLIEIGRFLNEEALLKGRSYRHGGDEFVVRAFDYDLKTVEETVAVLLERFARPWVIQDGEIQCKTSIGVARYPKDAENVSDLLHKADMAMYVAKRAGAGQARFYGEDRVLA